jgi:hypothetical protein
MQDQPTLTEEATSRRSVRGDAGMRIGWGWFVFRDLAEV